MAGGDGYGEQLHCMWPAVKGSPAKRHVAMTGRIHVMSYWLRDAVSRSLGSLTDFPTECDQPAVTTAFRLPERRSSLALQNLVGIDCNISAAVPWLEA